MGVAWEALLGPKLHGRIVLAAVGDRGAGDDAAAPFLIDLLSTTADLATIDCGSYPQNFLGVFARFDPDTVLLVDAAELGVSPGEVRILDAVTVTDLGGGTHGFPMELLLHQIEAATKAEVFLLAIQIAGLTRGSSLHPAVEKTVRDLAAFLENRYPRDHEG